MGLPGYFGLVAATALAGAASCSFLLWKRRFGMSLLTAAAPLALGGLWTVSVLYGPLASRLYFPEDTAYAPAFSETAFRAVGVGTSSTQVLAMLGKPLDRLRSTDGRLELWYYSHHGPRQKNYWMKILALDPRTNSVIFKTDEFYSN